MCFATCSLCGVPLPETIWIQIRQARKRACVMCWIKTRIFQCLADIKLCSSSRTPNDTTWHILLCHAAKRCSAALRRWRDNCCWNSTLWNLEFDETVPLSRSHIHTNQMRPVIGFVEQQQNTQWGFQLYSANLSCIPVINWCTISNSVTLWIMIAHTGNNNNPPFLFSHIHSTRGMPQPWDIWKRCIWVFIEGGCSRRGVQRMGVVLYNKTAYNIMWTTTPCFHCTPLCGM